MRSRSLSRTHLFTAVTVVIFGATGDLAKKKLFPALYQLCALGQLPRDLNITVEQGVVTHLPPTFRAELPEEYARALEALSWRVWRVSEDEIVL